MRRLLTALVAAAVVAPVLAAAPAYADAPSAPSGVSASGGYRSITIYVSPPEDDGGSEVTGYEYQLGNSGPWRRLPALTRADWLDDTFYAPVKGLPDRTSYWPAVRAVNADGVSAPRRMPGEAPPARTFGPPDEVGTVGLYPRDRSLVLDNYNSLDIYSPYLPEAFRLVLDPVAPGLRTRRERCEDYSCRITGLRNGATYRLTLVPIKVYRVFGDGGVLQRTYRFRGKPTPAGTVVPWPGPQEPRSFAAQPAKQSARLTWSFADWGYRQSVTDVEVSVDGGPWQRLESDGYSATIAGLDDGQTYSLRLRGLAPGSLEPGLPSTPVTVTPGSPS